MYHTNDPRVFVNTMRRTSIYMCVLCVRIYTYYSVRHSRHFCTRSRRIIIKLSYPIDMYSVYSTYTCTLAHARCRWSGLHMVAAASAAGTHPRNSIRPLYAAPTFGRDFFLFRRSSSRFARSKKSDTSVNGRKIRATTYIIL